MRRSGCALLLAAALSGCGNGGTVVSGRGVLSFDNGHVVLRPFGQPDATISATGDLAIAGKDVAVTSAERNLLVDYYGHAVALRNDGLKTGVAGAAVASAAIGSVIKGLFHGDPDKIGTGIDAKAEKVDQQARALCTEVRALRITQKTLAAQMATFQPYAVFNEDDGDACDSD
jgi:hypothetical protein